MCRKASRLTQDPQASVGPSLPLLQIFTGNVHFGNHFALEGSSRKKSEICR